MLTRIFPIRCMRINGCWIKAEIFAVIGREFANFAQFCKISGEREWFWLKNNGFAVDFMLFSVIKPHKSEKWQIIIHFLRRTHLTIFCGKYNILCVKMFATTINKRINCAYIIEYSLLVNLYCCTGQWQRLQNLAISQKIYAEFVTFYA